MYHGRWRATQNRISGVIVVAKRRKPKDDRRSRKDSRTKSSRKKEEEDKWSPCPDCGVEIKTKNLQAHIKKVHSGEPEKELKQAINNERSQNIKKNEIKKRDVAGTWGQRREDIAFLVVLVIIIGSITGGYFYYEKQHKNEGEDDRNDQVDDDFSDGQENDWWENYNPAYYQGSGNSDWWIKYPDQHPNSGQTIDHLNWIKQDIEIKPVLFVIHKTGCVTCQPQAEKSNQIAQEYPNDLIFYDLDVADGSSTYDRGMEAFFYDPNDAQNYIALTALFTHIKDGSGTLSIGWHSWEGDMDKSLLESWVKDAIYYYKENEVK